MSAKVVDLSGKPVRKRRKAKAPSAQDDIRAMERRAVAAMLGEGVDCLRTAVAAFDLRADAIVGATDYNDARNMLEFCQIIERRMQRALGG